MLTESELCKNNPVRHISKHFWIKDMDADVRPIRKLKWAQLRLLALYYWFKREQRPIRIIILKARKEGLSTLTQALMLIEALERGINAVVIAHDKETAQDIFEIGERFFTKYDLKKPDLRLSNRKEIKFKGVEGHIQVLTAGNVKAGTGLTTHFLHSSEAAKWPKGAETASALFQSVGRSSKTAHIIECTAYGFDLLFKPMWDNSQSGCKIHWGEEGGFPFVREVEITDREHWNGYVPLFIPWYEDPQYSREFETREEHSWFQESMSKEERDRMELYGLTLEQCHAYRWLLKSECRGDTETRYQEYPSSPEEAFIHSGRPRFKTSILNLMPVKDGRVGSIVPVSRMSRELRFEDDSGADTELWSRPTTGHEYVIGVDTAEGKIPEGSKKPDATVCQVLDRTRGGEQVCILRGQISEENLVEPLLLLAEFYNGAYVVIENNSTGKHVAIQMGKKYEKIRLYHNDDWNEEKRRYSREIGHRTTAGNRRLMIGKLANHLESHGLILYDQKTVHELNGFHTTAGGKAEAAQGYHDDHVMSLSLACIGLDSYPDKLKPYSPYARRGFPRSLRFSGGRRKKPIY
jgi:hypothetical protein